MSSILYKLYHGLYSGSEYDFSADSEYGKIYDRLIELETELLGKLPEEVKALFAEYVSLSADMDCMTGEHGFEQGFRLGMRLALETMGCGETERAFRRP